MWTLITICRKEVGHIKKRIVVGITGASGAIYGIRLLESLRTYPIEVHLVMSHWGQKTTEWETGKRWTDIQNMADYLYDDSEMTSSIASGSFLHEGMIVVPCSMKTLAGIRYGFSQNLLQRAADVTLKERRKLILVPRESPLSTIHLENMLALSQMGAQIVPPIPSFYHHPCNLDDMVQFTVLRFMDALGIHEPDQRRWKNHHESVCI